MGLHEVEGDTAPGATDEGRIGFGDVTANAGHFGSGEHSPRSHRTAANKLTNCARTPDCPSSAIIMSVEGCIFTAHRASVASKVGQRTMDGSPATRGHFARLTFLQKAILIQNGQCIDQQEAGLQQGPQRHQRLERFATLLQHHSATALSLMPATSQFEGRNRLHALARLHTPPPNGTHATRQHDLLRTFFLSSESMPKNAR